MVRAPAASDTPTSGAHGQSLVTKVREAIRTQITNGNYKPGDRLPSEARLTQEFGVSRTVVREAVVSLRSDRLLEARQGAGVFVLEPPPVDGGGFPGLNLARVSSLIEMLELRTAVEGDAAGLAALRRSPAQEENIIEAFEHSRRGSFSADADFRFHLAIAEATNNPRFSEFLRLPGVAIIPRRTVGGDASPRAYLEMLAREHERILTAILDNDEGAARATMREHLKNSQERYRSLARKQRRGG